MSNFLLSRQSRLQFPGQWSILNLVRCGARGFFLQTQFIDSYCKEREFPICTARPESVLFGFVRALGVRLFLRKERSKTIQQRVALIGILVENKDSVEKINSLLHQWEQYIIGRMGIPHRERGVSIISIAMDAPQDAISALSGKLGSLPGVSSKVIYTKA